MKTHIDVIASKESYGNLSTFVDIDDMNKTVRTYRDVIRASIKRADVQARLIALLEVLKRHSCKYLGVSMMCKNTIADKLGVSYKTVQRLMSKLVDFGMIRQIPMKRQKDMLQTSNAIIIVPTEDMTDKTPDQSPTKCPANKTNASSLKTNNLNKRNSYDESNMPVDNIQQANFVSHWVPERFSNLVNCFYQESQTIQEFWKVVRQCNRVVNYVTGDRAFSNTQELEIGIRAIKEFVMKVKRGTKMKRGIFAYFNGIVDILMDKLYWDTDFMEL